MHDHPSVAEVSRNFEEYVDRVAEHGERFILMRGERPVAELRPVPKGRRLGDLPALLASLPRLSEAEAAAFAEDIAQARSELSQIPPADPWGS